MSSCFELQIRRLYCPFIGDYVDPRECQTCDEPACAWSRARQRDRRCRS